MRRFFRHKFKVDAARLLSLLDMCHIIEEQGNRESHTIFRLTQQKTRRRLNRRSLKAYEEPPMDDLNHMLKNVVNYRKQLKKMVRFIKHFQELKAKKILEAL